MFGLIHNSGCGKKTRRLWNGKDILWAHIAQVANDEMNRPLKLIPKLTMEHVQLNAYSVMKVKYATQVLSQTMANVLYAYYPSEMHGTAQLCVMMNAFFDCCNVRNQTEGNHSRNDFVKPYRSTDDRRFHWLTNVFLQYFEDWRNNIKTRPGHYVPVDQDRMFISHQTYE